MGKGIRMRETRADQEDETRERKAVRDDGDDYTESSGVCTISKGEQEVVVVVE
jgi:hypothetical protein